MSKWRPSSIRMLGAADVSTLLSRDAEFQGIVRSQGAIRIDGVVRGDVISETTVTVGTSGAVDGCITAEDIIISGRVTGTITARGRVTLEATAQLEGDLAASRLSIADGAYFRGISSMGNAVRSVLSSNETSEKELEDVAAA